MGLLDEAIREHLALKRGRGADPAEIARQEKEALGPPTRAEVSAPEERDEPEAAALDEPATALTPDDDALRAGREPSEPRLRLADEPPEPDEPRPAPERREDPTVSEPPPPAEPRLRITEEDLRERMHGAGTPPPPPPPPVAPVDDVPGVHDEPVAPAQPADEEPLPDVIDDEPHTEDFVFGDEDDDFFADELDGPGAGEPEAAGPAVQPLAQPTQQYDLEDVEDATDPPGSPAPPTGEEGEPEGEDLLEETPEFLEETPDHDRLWFEQRPPRDFDF